MSSAFWPGAANSRSGTRPSDFRPDVDHREVVLDRGDDALDDLAFEGLVLAAEDFVEQRREIVAGRKCRGGHKVCSLRNSQLGLPRGRHHGEPSHADLVKCTAAAAPCRRGILWVALLATAHPMQKARSGAGIIRDTVRARQRDGLSRGDCRLLDGGRFSLEGRRGQGAKPPSAGERLRSEREPARRAGAARPARERAD